MTTPTRAPRRVRHLLKTLHLWLGLSLGLVLSLVMLSGAILTFEEPLLATAHPELTGRAVPDTAGLGQTLDHVFASPEARKLRGLSLPDARITAFEGNLRGDGRIYFDPSTGQAILRRSGNDPMLLLLTWHTHLLSGDVGETVLGIVAWTGIFMLISGVWLYWPGRKRALTHLRPHPRPPILRWASWHRFAGIVTLPLLIVMIVTGTAMAYRGFVHQQLPKLFGDAAPARAPKLEPGVAGKADWASLIAAAQAAAPGATLTRIQLPGKDDAPVTFRVRYPGEWNVAGRSMVWLDPRNAKLLGGTNANQAGPGTRLADALFPVHSAAVGGAIWHALAIVGGVMPSVMLVTGFLFWRARRRRPAAGA